MKTLKTDQIKFKYFRFCRNVLTASLVNKPNIKNLEIDRTQFENKSKYTVLQTRRAFQTERIEGIKNKSNDF